MRYLISSIFISTLIFLGCETDKPDVNVSVVSVDDFSVELSIQLINFEDLDSIVIKRIQEPFLPLIFVYKKPIKTFIDTTVCPNFSYRYEIKVEGKSSVTRFVDVKTKLPRGSYLVPNPIYVVSKENFPLDVMIFNINNIFGMSGRILFKSSVLGVDSIKKGTFWDQNDIFFYKVEGDTIFFAVTKQRGENPVSGSGQIFRIFFSKKAVGSSQILPFNLTLTDQHGEYLSSPKIKGGIIELK